MDTRKVELKNGQIQTEYYIECKGCGTWRWTTSTISRLCMDCSRSGKAKNKEVRKGDYTKEENQMIEDFLKTSKPSVVIQQGEQDTFFNEVSSCYPNFYFK